MKEWRTHSSILSSVAQPFILNLFQDLQLKNEDVQNPENLQVIGQAPENSCCHHSKHDTKQQTPELETKSEESNQNKKFPSNPSKK